MNVELSGFNTCSADMDPNGECVSDMPHERLKFVSDSVHKYFGIDPLCVKIIDTSEFQRLRNISQCGFCKFVYPCAGHSRFEHSLGVYYLAGEMMKALEDNTGKCLFEPHEKLCVRIGGLVHDLGHGPFSHSWECFLHKNEIEFKHEEMSIKMFHHLIKKNHLEQDLKARGIGSNELQMIKDIIMGNSSSEVASKKPYMFQIVANKSDEIDVDKWDYMLRDGQMFGIPFDVCYQRLLSSVKVNCEGLITFGEKMAPNIEEILLYRAKMHKKCYQHRVGKCIEIMFFDALKKAPNYTICVENKRFKLTECHENLYAYSKLTDTIFYNILYSEEEELAEARKLLKNIETRVLYKYLGLFPLGKEIESKILEKHFTSAVKEKVKKSIDFRFTVNSYSKKSKHQFDPDNRYTDELLCFCANAESFNNDEIEEIKVTLTDIYNSFKGLMISIKEMPQ